MFSIVWVVSMEKGGARLQQPSLFTIIDCYVLADPWGLNIPLIKSF
jgi:hypothetical protein